MILESRENLGNGRKDVYTIPESTSKLVYERGKYYISDCNGKIISKKYDKISEFKNGVAIVTLDEKSNAINTAGETLLKKWCDKAALDEAVIRICSKGKWGFADLTGKILCIPKFSFLEKFTNGYARFYDEDKRWGVISISGRIAIPAKYRQLGGLGSEVIIAKNYSKYGGIDIHGKVVIPFRYKTIGYEDNKPMLYNDSKDKVVV